MKKTMGHICVNHFCRYERPKLEARLRECMEILYEVERAMLCRSDRTLIERKLLLRIDAILSSQP